MRPLDKELQFFEPYEVLFEQYIDTGLFDLGENTLEHSGSDDFSRYLELPRSSSRSDLPCNPPAIEWDVTQGKPSQPWEKAHCYLKQTSASVTARSRRTSLYSDSYSKAAVSETELYSLGRFDSPQIKSGTAASTPSNSTFPNAEHRKSRTVSHINDLYKSTSCGISKSMRKPTNSPKMMRGSNYRPALHELWSQRIEATMDKYSLQMPVRSGPLSPPPSAKVKQEENGQTFYGKLMNSGSPDLDNTLSPLSNQFQNLSHISPLATPLIDHANGQGNSYFGSPPFPDYNEHSEYVANAMDDLMTPPQTRQLSTSTWTAEQQDQQTYEFDATSPDISSWPTGNIAHASSNDVRDNVRQPSHSLTRLTNDVSFGSGNNSSAAAAADLATNGLLIDMHGMSGGGDMHVGEGGREGSGPSTTSDLSALSPIELKLNQSNPSCTHNYPAPPTIPASASPINLTSSADTTATANIIVPSRVRRQQSSPASSPDLPLSSLRTRRGGSRSRNTSLHLHQPSNSSHPQQSHHRRSKSSTTRSLRSPGRAHRRHSRTQSSTSPSSGGGNGGNVGFINFTPDDSRRILTGVAPSGSSKTKARREKEAAEKRRKLSEAAVKAVEEAGGDVRVLDGVVLE
ncbi:MAG: hypothetical protein Q9157_000426 [Trypethelium eluteriae]